MLPLALLTLDSSMCPLALNPIPVPPYFVQLWGWSGYFLSLVLIWFELILSGLVLIGKLVFH